ncbi:hypothetical protein SAMN04488090_1393 [Siphonobacter aquaeclarae]|uniref:Uncharacterized protein n=2 Tax=Siphonobacter aquaeclarae TaxID=563176 RepID=A0A1G9LFC7_9BACT|nr:hypothetical protein SAMN04488090_1393 [Siphonobacter aquaeclarae]
MPGSSTFVGIKSVTKMTRQKKLFVIGFVLFLLLVIGMTIDMARRTTAPWNKKKTIDRVLPITPDSTRK